MTYGPTNQLKRYPNDRKNTNFKNLTPNFLLKTFSVPKLPPKSQLLQKAS